MKKTIGYFIAIVLVVTACTFDPNGENFVNIDDEYTSPEIRTITPQLEEDSIFVWSYTALNLNFSSDNQPINAMEVSFGGHTTVYYSNQGTLELNPSVYADGAYKLNIKLYISSGTGSLADKLGYEGLVAEGNWTVVFETPQSPDANITTEVKDGYLQFHWTAMKKPYFKSYEIFYYNREISTQGYVTISDPNQTTFVDSSFVGGQAQFRITYNYSDQYNSVSSNTSYFTYEFPVKMQFEESRDSLTIRWNKIPFHHTTSYSVTGGQIIELDVDSSYTIPTFGFTLPKQYMLRFKPLQQLTYDHQGYTIYQTHTKGINHNVEHSSILYSKRWQSYYVYDPMYVKRLNENFEVLASYDYTYDYSHDANIALAPNEDFVLAYQNKQLVKLKADDLSVLDRYDLGTFPNSNYDIRFIRCLSDKLVLLGSYMNFSIFDLESKQFVGEASQTLLKSTYSNVVFFSASPDGRYAVYSCYDGIMIFEIINNSQFVLQYKDTRHYYSHVFEPLADHQLILNEENTIELFNPETASVERELTFLNELKANPVNFDPVSNKLFLISYQQQKVFVYDYYNQKLLDYYRHKTYLYDIHLLNNTIVTDWGYHFYLPDYDN